MQTSRSKCSSPCCEVVTKRLCAGCENEHICKKHNKCVTCKVSKSINTTLEKKENLSPEETKKEIARERARNYYRLKQGIPIEAPLIQRGGAHNVKYRTDEAKARRAEMDKEYQKEYQRKYRAEMKKIIINDSVYVMENVLDSLKAKKAKEDDTLYNMSFLLDSLKAKKANKIAIENNYLQDKMVDNVLNEIFA
jgi:hypothetical protein